MIKLHPLYRAGEIAPGVQREVADLVEFADTHDVGTFHFIHASGNPDAERGSATHSDSKPDEYLGRIILEGVTQANVHLASTLSPETTMPLYTVASVQLVEDIATASVHPEPIGPNPTTVLQ